MEIQHIQSAIQQEIYFREHAIAKMLQRNITEFEVVEAIQSGKIIEEYPEDKYGPTCLILGTTQTGRVLHVLTSYTTPIWVITTYEPDLNQWIDDRIRRT